MSKSVEVRSNIAGKLNKIRAGVVYQNVTSVLGELGQNAQRGGATRLDIQIDYSSFTFSDNGLGCDDPQLVFEFDKSGFGYGFGEGFSSVFTVADELIVHSKDWKVWLDVKHMLETGDFNIPVDEAAYYEGFKVYMQGEKIAEHHDELYKFAHELAALLPMDVYINDVLVEKLDLMKSGFTKEVDFIHVVDNDLFEAVLTPSSWEDFKTYFENRYVCNYYRSGAHGNIVFKPDAVTLKAPDRRSIVDDEKMWKFQDALEEAIKEMYREFVQIASNEQLDKYAEKIARYLKVEEYAHLLPMDSELARAKHVIKKEEKFKNMTDEQLMEYFKMNPPEFSRDRGYDSDTMTVGDNYDPELMYQDAEVGTVDHGRYEKPMSVTTPLVQHEKDKRGETKLFLDLMEKFNQQHKVLWIKASDYSLHKEEVKEFEYYGFVTLVANNRLYEEAYRELGFTYFHDAEKNVEKKYSFSNIGAMDKKEERVLWLLERIEKNYDLGSVFRIADIEHSVVHHRNGLLVDTEQKICHGAYREDRDGRKRIYLNRKSLRLPSYRVSNWESGRLTMADLRMMLCNFETIAHELAHLIHGTSDNTNEHNLYQSAIMQEISRLF